MQFNKKAQSKKPFFWLRKHIESISSFGGYFYANEDSTDLSFFPLSSNDKHKQPNVQGIAILHKRRNEHCVIYLLKYYMQSIYRAIYTYCI